MTPENARRSYQEIVDDMLGQLTAEGILTDTAPGSVTRTLVEASAREFAELYARMQAVYEAGFLETATGTALDQLVALLGLVRFSGASDIVSLRLSRDSRISARVIIPAGARVAIDRVGRDRVTYAVIDGDELRSGENTLVVSLRAQPPSDDPQADVTVSGDDVAFNQASFLDPVAGIAGLMLDGPSVKLDTNETDAQLRARARSAIASAGGGTEKALEQALMAVDGIAAVRLRDAGDPLEGGEPLRPGELEIILDAKPQVIAQNRAQIEAAIDRAKGPGIVARLRGTRQVVLGGRIVVQPSAPSLSGAQMLALVQACEEVLHKAIDALEIGAPLQWNRVLAALMAVENMGDVLVLQSQFLRDGSALPLGNIACAKTERLVRGSAENALACVIEDRPALSLSLQITATMPAPEQAVADAFEAELTAALIRYLETQDTTAAPVLLERAALIDALTGPDGIATLTAQISAATTSITVLDQSEGAEVVLSPSGPAAVSLPQKALLRVADPAVQITWEAPG